MSMRTIVKGAPQPTHEAINNNKRFAGMMCKLCIKWRQRRPSWRHFGAKKKQCEDNSLNGAVHHFSVSLYLASAANPYSTKNPAITITSIISPTIDAPIAIATLYLRE
ncbi:MAG: hypothetical protein KDD85_13735 [Parvularculaceae bacterium]|nr:hypothetical protein [Parvularculaceae bacterium]